MKLETGADHKGSQQEVARQHHKGEVDKFNQLIKTMEANNLSEEKRREIFERQGMSDLYEKHLEAGKNEAERAKTMERKKTLNAKEEQYKDLDNIAGVKIGTFAYEKKINELMQLARERKNYTQLDGQASEDAHLKLEDDLQKRLNANADVLQSKKDMMEPGDFERIQSIDEKIEQIRTEIANQMLDTNNLDFSGRIELEKQNDKLKEERMSIEAKYKGMGGI